MWPPIEPAETGEDDFSAEFAARVLARSRVAIVGLGLIGGSLALALGGHCREVLAVEPRAEARALALREGIVSAASADPTAVLPQADIVVLAAPVRAILALLTDLPNMHPGRALVLDVGSTKQAIVKAMAALPARFDPIGGHPMAGKTARGLTAAEAGLFRGAVFALTPLTRTSPLARAVAEALVHAVGAQPLFMTPAEHDRYAAAVSHLPYLLSLALALSTSPEEAVLAGPGFRSTTRLAASSPEMMGDILLTNRPAVLAALERFRSRLAALETALRSPEEEPLLRLLDQGQAHHRRLMP